MKIIVSLGGSSLLLRQDQPTPDRIKLNLMHAVHSLYKLVASGHQLIITHPCGPRIDNQQCAEGENPKPLDLLVAESDAMIGYLLKQELDNAIKGCPRVIDLVTSVEVSPDDPEFVTPTKQIGNVLAKEQAELLFESCTLAPEFNSWRRVVPSPKPISIPDISVIRALVELDVVVICAGGGGVPVIREYNGDWSGVEALIDKDRTAALLAESLQADMLLLLTDIDAVYKDFRTEDEQPIRQIPLHKLSGLSFPNDSMGVKVEAACEFVNQTDGVAGIGALENALEIVERESGTIITK